MRKLPGVLTTLEDHEHAVNHAEAQLIARARQPIATHYHARQAQLMSLESWVGEVRDAWAKYQAFISNN